MSSVGDLTTGRRRSPPVLVFCFFFCLVLGLGFDVWFWEVDEVDLFLCDDVDENDDEGRPFVLVFAANAVVNE